MIQEIIEELAEVSDITDQASKLTPGAPSIDLLIDATNRLRNCITMLCLIIDEQLNSHKRGGDTNTEYRSLDDRGKKTSQSGKGSLEKKV